MKYKILFSSRFKKNFEKLTNLEKQKTRHIIELLSLDIALPKNLKDHALQGNLKGFRECHIKDNLLLLYQKDNGILTVTVVNIGTHAKVLGL